MLFENLLLSCFPEKEKKRKREDSVGSDDTASMIKGGGYIDARTRQPPTAQTIKEKSVWVRGVVCRSTQTQSLTVVACVILQCIPCFYECRCMSDGVLIQFVCQFCNLMVVQITVCCQRFVCIVFVYSPHSSKLTFLYSCLFRLAISMLCCAFAFWQPLSIRLAIQLIEQDIKKLSTVNQFNWSVTRFFSANDWA